jgi:hypothetical protein
VRVRVPLAKGGPRGGGRSATSLEVEGTVRFASRTMGAGGLMKPTEYTVVYDDARAEMGKMDAKEVRRVAISGPGALVEAEDSGSGSGSDSGSGSGDDRGRGDGDRGGAHAPRVGGGHGQGSDACAAPRKQSTQSKQSAAKQTAAHAGPPRGTRRGRGSSAGQGGCIGIPAVLLTSNAALSALIDASVCMRRVAGAGARAAVGKGEGAGAGAGAGASTGSARARRREVAQVYMIHDDGSGVARSLAAEPARAVPVTASPPKQAGGANQGGQRSPSLSSPPSAALYSTYPSRFATICVACKVRERRTAMRGRCNTPASLSPNDTLRLFLEKRLTYLRAFARRVMLRCARRVATHLLFAAQRFQEGCRRVPQPPGALRTGLGSVCVA